MLGLLTLPQVRRCPLRSGRIYPEPDLGRVAAGGLSGSLRSSSRSEDLVEATPRPARPIKQQLREHELRWEWTLPVRPSEQAIESRWLGPARWSPDCDVRVREPFVRATPCQPDQGVSLVCDERRDGALSEVEFERKCTRAPSVGQGNQSAEPYFHRIEVDRGDRVEDAVCECGVHGTEERDSQMEVFWFNWAKFRWSLSKQVA